ncbi:MAG: hypothetical protein CUN54_05525 [Phototrophicales bacterium]|nr:MAG: hypothetical protein CUN54_05525 [Phototrophicales bacterium]
MNPINHLSRRAFLRNFTDQPQQQHAKTTAPQEYYTPSSRFFHQQIRHIPSIDLAHWSLTISNYPNSVTFTYEMLRQLPAEEIISVIACAGNDPQRKFVGNARWRGIQIGCLFDQMNSPSTPQYAQFYSADGYITSLPTDALSQAVLAYEMNGEVLLPEHGFPLRLTVPNHYGYKMPKWIGRIELTDEPIASTWEQQSPTENSLLQLDAAIRTPRNRQIIQDDVLIAGIAYSAGKIKAVELSINGGDWMPVPSIYQEQYGWAQWQIVWRPSTPGDYRITVRAHDGRSVQLPDSLHSTIVQVVA